MGSRVNGFLGSRVPRLMSLRVYGFTGYRFLGLQFPGFPGSWVPMFPGLRVYGLRIPGFTGSGVSGFPGSWVPGFTGSQVYGISVSRVLCIHAPANYGVVHLVLVFFINTP